MMIKNNIVIFMIHLFGKGVGNIKLLYKKKNLDCINNFDLTPYYIII